jgi:hypothetical protein
MPCGDILLYNALRLLILFSHSKQIPNIACKTPKQWKLTCMIMEKKQIGEKNPFKDTYLSQKKNTYILKQEQEQTYLVSTCICGTEH